MKYDSNIHHTKSIRLKYYNYASEGLYFVTICTQNKQSILGHIKNGKIQLNNYGQIIKKEIIKPTQIREKE